MASRISVGLLVVSGLDRVLDQGLGGRLGLRGRLGRLGWTLAGFSALAGASGASSCSTTCVPEKSEGAVGSVASEKTSQSARITSWAESSPKVVVCTWGRLANERSTSSSFWPTTTSTEPFSLSLRKMVAASLVLGPSIFQSSTTTIWPMSARSLSAESSARRTILRGVRCA